MTNAVKMAIEALADIRTSIECATGCDEGIDPMAAVSEIMSAYGTAMASAYSRAADMVNILAAVEHAGEPVAADLLDRAELAWQRFFYPAADCFAGPAADKLPSVDLEVADCLRLVLAAIGRLVVTPETDVPAPLPTDEPSAWTGSGSMAALKDGREGFIWPAKSDAHPIPLYARPPGEVIALQLDRKVGMYGCAYDPPGPCRAYTYEHQPSNLPAYSLGQAHAAAAAMSAGDNIDRGLGLLKALEDQGFGVFEIGRA